MLISTPQIGLVFYTANHQDRWSSKSLNSGLSAGGLVECCQYRVDPLLLLGIIAAIGGLTFFLQQQGINYFVFCIFFI